MGKSTVVLILVLVVLVVLTGVAATYALLAATTLYKFRKEQYLGTAWKYMSWAGAIYWTIIGLIVIGGILILVLSGGTSLLALKAASGLFILGGLFLIICITIASGVLSLLAVLQIRKSPIESTEIKKAYRYSIIATVLTLGILICTIIYLIAFFLFRKVAKKKREEQKLLDANAKVIAETLTK